MFSIMNIKSDSKISQGLIDAGVTIGLDPIKIAKALAERKAIEALYTKHGLFGYGLKS